jgi:tetratricopeptide (TPR) repeat protein
MTSGPQSSDFAGSPKPPEPAHPAKKRRLSAQQAEEIHSAQSHPDDFYLHEPTRAQSSSVRLNVGGTVHETLRKTTRKMGVVHTALSIAPQQKDFFFDRNGTLFGQMLDFYRNNCRLPAGLAVPHLKSLKFEAEYFDCPTLLTEIKYLYTPREAVRQVKHIGGTELATAYRSLALALCEHDSPHYAERKLRRAEALDRDLLQSLPFYQAWVKRCPREAEAWRQLGVTHEALGNLEHALTAFLRALEQRVSPEAHCDCARTLGRQSQYAAAQHHYDQALKLLERVPDADLEFLTSIYTGQGSVCAHQRKFHDARHSYAQAVRLVPGKGVHHYMLGRVSWLLGDLEAAFASVSAAIVLVHNVGPQHLLLGRIEQARHNLPQAQEAFAVAAQLMPTRTEPLWGLAQVLDAQGNFAQKEAALLRLVALEPAHALFWAELGRAREHLANWSGAEMAYRTWVQLEPNNPAALLRLGALRVKMQKYAEAEAPLEGAIALGEPSARPHVALGIAYFKQGKAVQAEQHFLRATQLAPNDASHHFQLGQVCTHLGKYTEAQAAYTVAVELAEQEPEPRYHLGRVLILLGDYAAAETALRRAVELREEHVPYRQDLASCLLERQDFTAAHRHYLACAVREPSVSRHLLGLAKAYVGLGQPADAESALVRANVLDPRCPEVQSMLANFYFG